jgi:YVTN family beta-propeller protein
VVKQTSGLYENAQIHVGKSPGTIGIDRFSGMVYVANEDSNTVSVISGWNNTKIGDIYLLEKVL